MFIYLICVMSVVNCKTPGSGNASTKAPDVSSLFPDNGPLGENCWNNPTSDNCQPHRFLPSLPCSDLFNVWMQTGAGGRRTGRSELPEVIAVDELLRSYHQPSG